MKLLIVVDMQNDFVDGALANPAAKAIIPEIQKRLDEAKANNDRVVFTMDTHYNQSSSGCVKYEDSLEGKLLPIKHCVIGTPGWEIVEPLKEYLEKNTIATTVIKKTFGFLDWEEYLDSLFDENTFPEDFPEEIELCGTCTDICVVSNALILRALYPNMPIVVDSKLCAGLTPEKHEAALETMRSCQIHII